MTQTNQLLIWTTEKPTEPGWYWYRETLKDPPSIERVVHYGPLGLFVKGPDLVEGDDLEIKFYSGDWAGPLEPPT